MKNYQFYHIYPLGMLDKLNKDDKNNGLNNGRQLEDLVKFTPHLESMHINGVYLGPVFMSESHGYDTISYYEVDGRLGDNDQLKFLVSYWKNRGIDTILDCVFNHVSRQFFAFDDVLNKGKESSYRDWFGIDWKGNNKYGDGFSYDTWDGHEALVKLNLNNRQVRDYLIEVASFWVDTFDIAGLRMDAADVMDRSFLKELVVAMKAKKEDFIFIGEMVQDGHEKLLKETGMDSTTNYECYKGLYSSLNDSNYHEIAYSFRRLMGSTGLVKDYHMYNFVDNHDVNRVAGQLHKEAHLYPLYIMLYTMKGYPSLYYRSEIGDRGLRTNTSDMDLRKPFELSDLEGDQPLVRTIQKLSAIRKYHPAFAYGTYEEIHVDHTLIGYIRSYQGRNFMVFINSDDRESVIDKSLISHWKGKYGLDGYDLLSDQHIEEGHMTVHGNWARIIC